MKDTNAVQDALLKKISDELDEITNRAINDIHSLKTKYQCGASYFNLRKERDKSEITSLGIDALTRIYKNMLKEAFESSMLKQKTKELLDKLEIL